MIRKLVLALLIFVSTSVLAKRYEIDFSHLEWRVWLDKAAQWDDDKLFLPPFSLSQLPQNPPSIGWDSLYDGRGKVTKLPATVEQLYWGDGGSSYGATGDYVGVSWFYTLFQSPFNAQKKRICLKFESTRLRAEVYLNGVLVGYNLTYDLPFEVDITEFIKSGETNTLAVRITDPFGNFDWKDGEPMYWGDYEMSPTKGFAGVTGRVVMVITDKTFVEDIYVRNTPNINTVDVDVFVTNTLTSRTSGRLRIDILEQENFNNVVYSMHRTVNLDDYGGVVNFPVRIRNSKLWSPKSSTIYVVRAVWEGDDRTEDQLDQTFGLRYFEVKDIAGDKMFFLNGKRIFLRSALSSGYWPINGAVPTDELARKEVLMAKKLGLNMLSVKGGVASETLLTKADEHGMLIYQEPGGYRAGQSEFARKLKRERFLQMVRRDRNHPSLIINNLINEAGRNPYPNEKKDIRDAQNIDYTRTLTFSSLGVDDGKERGINFFMLPYDSTSRSIGWLEQTSTQKGGVYNDENYTNSNSYLLKTNESNQIIYWTNEGAIGAPPKLDLLTKTFKEQGKNGWDGDAYGAMRDSYADFIERKGFKEAFPTVDDLTTSLANISYYANAKAMENARISNVSDAYSINAWEDSKLTNNSGIVDVYRNNKGSSSILANSNRPFFVAVKCKHNVLAVRDTAYVDFYAVNESGLSGKFNLRVEAKNNEQVVFTRSYSVKLSGGMVYGELLQKNCRFTISRPGYTSISATLMRGSEEIANGSDRIFASKLPKELPSVAALDFTNMMQEMLYECGVADFEKIESEVELPKSDVLLIGGEVQTYVVHKGKDNSTPVLDWVKRGNTLLILQNADEWAQHLDKENILDYRGSRELATGRLGGNFFVKEHPIFKGLPVNRALNWEYQSLVNYEMNRVGLRTESGNTIVGASADHKNELLSALVVIPHGQGKIILSSLDFYNAIMYGGRPAVVAKQILRNMIVFGKKPEYTIFKEMSTNN